MPAIDRDVIAQGKKLLPDTFQQRIHITAGQVRAANAAVEEYVAAEHEALLRVVEGHMPWGVAGHEEHVQVFIAQFYDFAFFNKALWSWNRFAVHAEHRPAYLRVLQDEQVFAVYFRQQVVAAFQPGTAQHMVHVGVGEQEARGPHFVFIQPRFQLPLLVFIATTGVHNYTFTGGVQNVCILLKRVEREFFDVHGD